MKIYKYSEFFLNESVTVPEVIKDFIELLKDSPVVTIYPEDDDGKSREGWITKEHKIYSMPGIKKYFEKKYGEEYSAANVGSAIQYEPNIKSLKKQLEEAGMNLQITKVKALFGDMYPFYSSNLTDKEIESIKEKYEEEFKKRYKVAVTKSTKKPKVIVKKNEDMEILIYGLFNLNEVNKWIPKNLKKDKVKKMLHGDTSTKNINDKLKKLDADKNKPGIQSKNKKELSDIKALNLAKTFKKIKK